MNSKEDNLIKLLEKQLSDICMVSKDEYIDYVAQWFAYIILNQPKYILDHSFDPSYDCSGSLFKDKEGYNLDDYNILYDFAKDSYNGISRASYISGCGFFYDTYECDLQEETESWINNKLEKLLCKLLGEDNLIIKEWLEELEKETKEEIAIDDFETIIDELYFFDIISDIVFNISYELIEIVNTVSVKFLFKKGKKKAKERIIKEQKEKEQRAKERAIKHDKAKKIWDKVVKIYQMKAGDREELNHVQKPFYDKNIAPILKEIYNEGVSKEEIQLIGEFLSYKFSNSVSRIISNFKD